MSELIYADDVSGTLAADRPTTSEEGVGQDQGLNQCWVIPNQSNDSVVKRKSVRWVAWIDSE